MPDVHETFMPEKQRCPAARTSDAQDIAVLMLSPAV